MLNAAYITLASPAMLGGLVLVALPIAAHLLNRRTRRRIVFPTIRLLVESRAMQSRLFRLRDVLLLVLRCLAVAAIVLCFAQPVWFERRARRAGAGDGAAVVVVLDTSASTGRRVDGVVAADALRAAAGGTLDSLRAGADRANLVFAAARPRAVVPQLTANLGVLRNALADAGPTYQRADMGAAVELAGQMLATHEGETRLVLISDLQATNFIDDAVFAGALPEGTTVTVWPFEHATPDNVGLVNPRALPWPAEASRRTQLMVTAVNMSAMTKQVRVDMHMSEEQAQSMLVGLSPWQRREVGFEVALDAGEHGVVFSSSDDALGADNRAYLVVKVVDRVPLVVVSRDVRSIQSGGYFLLRALSPDADVGRYHVRGVDASRLARDALEDAACVFVCDAGPMPPPALDLLREFVDAGGQGVWFVVDEDDRRGFEVLIAAGQSGAGAAIVLGAARTAGRGGSPWQIGEGDWRRPAFGSFDAAARAALQRIAFHRVRSIDAVRDDAHVMLQFDDGTAALVSVVIGEGGVLAANFHPTPVDTDLPKFGAFVALLHGVVDELRSKSVRRGAQAAYAGLPVYHALSDAAGELAATGPKGRAAPVELMAGEAGRVAMLAAPDEPGFYQITHGRRAANVVAVNVDERESDLRPDMAQRVAATLTGESGRTQIAAAAAGSDIVDTGGRPLWHMALLAGMAALGVELALVGWWNR